MSDACMRYICVHELSTRGAWDRHASFIVSVFSTIFYSASTTGDAHGL